MEIASYAQAALDALRAAGHEAYVVGGAVRDLLRGETPADYDLATDATPDEVGRCFARCIPTGERHGTVTALIDNRPVEITTYRVDGGYSDARHPDGVTYTRSLAEDLRRRDFTVNAMAYDGETVTDLFGGREDLAAGVIRAVGAPDERFREDALRILRAFRFAAQLDFTVEPKTLAACIRQAPLLEKISRERIFSELTRTLCGVRPQALQPLADCGGLPFPGISKADLAPLADLPRTEEIRLAAFCRLCGAEANDFLRGLRASNKQRIRTAAVFAFLQTEPNDDKTVLKQQLCALPEELWQSAVAARGTLLGRDFSEQSKRAAEILRNKEPYRIAMLAVNGDDLRSAGATGRQIGRLQKRLLEDVLADPALNNRQTLLTRAKAYLR